MGSAKEGLDRALVARLVREEGERESAHLAEAPFLKARLNERRGASVHGFFRGTLDLFYALLDALPWLAEGPATEGFVVGDLHLENVGAWRTGGDDAAVRFDLNDLDAAGKGRHQLDLLRLAASVLLSGDRIGLSVFEQRGEVLGCLDAWRETAEGGRMPAAPPVVERFVEKVSGRTKDAFLADRTETAGKGLRFVRGARYRDVAKGLAREAAEAFLAHRGEGRKKALAVEDVAFRIAGNGSLGSLRLALLVREDESPRRWVYEMKSASPATAPWVAEVGANAAERVVRASETLLEEVPRDLGAVMLGAHAMVVRRLAPQEDKLDLDRIARDDRRALVGYVGALVGRAHRRGAGGAIKGWSEADFALLSEQAAWVETAMRRLWRAWGERAGE